MKYILFFLLLSVTIPAVSQDALNNISGTWKAVSKIETKTKGGSVTEKDEEIYQAGEKTYAFTGTEVTITQGYGKHNETLPLHITGNQVFID